MSSCFTSVVNKPEKPSDIIEKPPDDYQLKYVMGTTFLPSLKNDSLGTKQDSPQQTQASYLLRNRKKNLYNRTEKSSQQKNKYYSFVVRGGSGFFRPDGLNGISFSLREKLKPKLYGQIYGGYSRVPLQKTAGKPQAIEFSFYILSLGAECVAFNTPEYTFMGQYFILGVAYNHMIWNYKEPSYPDAYNNSGNIIEKNLNQSDMLSGMDLHIGMGFNLIQISGLQLGLEATPGIKFWWGKTYNGFSNDVLDPFFYVKLRASVNFSLPELGKHTNKK